MRKDFHAITPADADRKLAEGDVTPEKAKQILKDDSAQGQPLTDKQKRYFGWKAGGGK